MRDSVLIAEKDSEAIYQNTLPMHMIKPNVKLFDWAPTTADPLTNPKNIPGNRGEFNFPVGDAKDVMGLVRSDAACNVDIYWGFSQTNRTEYPDGHYVNTSSGPILYDAKEASIAVPANFAEGAGVKIGPIPCGAEFMKVIVTGAVTTNFRIAMWKRF